MFYDLSRLDAEWRRIARSPSACCALHTWGLTHTVFRHVANLDELLERRRDPVEAPRILSALARLAPTDDLAARTLLQALVPGFVTLALSVGRDDPVALDEIVSLAWERIRTYPAGRTGSVAGNVVFDVRRSYLRSRRVEASASPIEVLVDRSRREPSAEDEAVGRLAFLELWALLREVVGDRGHRAIVRTRYAGLSLAEAAAEENVGAHTIAMRQYDARARFLRNVPAAS